MKPAAKHQIMDLKKIYNDLLVNFFTIPDYMHIAANIQTAK